MRVTTITASTTTRERMRETRGMQKPTYDRDGRRDDTAPYWMALRKYTRTPLTPPHTEAATKPTGGRRRRWQRLLPPLLPATSDPPPIHPLSISHSLSLYQQALTLTLLSKGIGTDGMPLCTSDCALLLALSSLVLGGASPLRQACNRHASACSRGC